MERVFLISPSSHTKWFDRASVENSWEKILGGFTHRLFLTRLGAWVTEQLGPKGVHQIEQVTAPEARAWLVNLGLYDDLKEAMQCKIEAEVGRFEI